MIDCLLVHITRNSRGEAIREEREIASDVLRIGRGTSCILHLPDPRINLHHAQIQYGDDGKLYLEAGKELLNFNGNFRKREALQTGMRILIGPYELRVEENDKDHALILSYELIQPLSDEQTDLIQYSRTDLAQSGLSKRSIALVLGLFILTAFLILPVLNTLRPELKAASKNLPLALDESWNPGPISAGHQGFAKDCQQCHSKPFVRVEDAACKTCHEDIGDHVSIASMQAKLFGETRCASCHLEHKETPVIARGNPALCVDCHGNLAPHKRNHPALALNDIHDFADDHPGFKLSFKASPVSRDIQRINQADKTLSENSGLKFPHDVHLAAEGVKSPDGKSILQCANCHTPDKAGVRFEPITMQTHCANCHRLEFEPAVTSRQVPHGNVRDAMTSLREFYGSQSVSDSPIDVATVDGLLRRPEQAESKVVRARASEWANRKAATIATDLFEARVCSTCHQVSRVESNADEPWAIAPINITEHWLPKNNFSHRQHTNSECSVCHNVTVSKKSADINLPDINTCRTCHAGAKAERNKVTSTCESCHGFHLPNHARLSLEKKSSADNKALANGKGTP